MIQHLDIYFSTDSTLTETRKLIAMHWT